MNCLHEEGTRQEILEFIDKSGQENRTKCVGKQYKNSSPFQFGDFHSIIQWLSQVANYVSLTTQFLSCTCSLPMCS